VAIRGLQTLITDWLGLNSSADPENIKANWWTDSNNVIVDRTGTAVVLRSPADFNNALSTSNPVLSAFDYDKQTGNLILFDIDNVGGTALDTFSTTGTTNTSVRTGQLVSARWVSLTINDFAYRLNGTEFIQTNGAINYAAGVTGPAAAPTISWVAGGSGSFASGVDVTYAYRNSATGEVSKMSATSNRLGASTGSTLRIAVTASAQSGVDKIVVFLTVDGGSVRYLLVDSAGAPQQFTNATGNIDVSIADIFRDTQTTETAYNDVPPQNAFQMFKWRDRIVLLDFRAAATRQQIQYSGYESITYGTPFSCFPSLNIINIPNKGDAARCGVSTVLGALILAEQDSYLLSGYPSDKTSAPEGSIAVSEHLEPLNWGIGTKYPRTLVTTPFGEIWLDQDRHIRLWNHTSKPIDIGAPLQVSLNTIQTTAAAFDAAQAVWFEHPTAGGMFVLTASTTGSTNNKLFILNLYLDPETGERKVTYAISDIAVQCLLVADVSGKRRLFGGVADRLREILDTATQGAGWSAETRFFQCVVGTDSEYCYWHSLRFDADSITGLTITVTDLDGGGSVTVTPAQDETAWRGIIDAYGYRKIIKFSWNTTDTTYRDVKNLRVSYKPTGRII
jgi:hypothetical protein